MRRTVLVGSMLVLILIGIGCGGGVAGDREERMAMKYGHTAARYDQGMDPEIQKAPWAGMYYLYPTTPEGKPKARAATMEVALKPGDPIGFQTSPDNPALAVIAVAGDQRLAVPNTTYRWLYRQAR